MRIVLLLCGALVSCASRDTRSGESSRKRTASASARPVAPPLVLAAEAAASSRWMTSESCARCHGKDPRVFRAGDGEDLSPQTGWASSMMALSARDPYFLAALEREIWHTPGGQVVLEKTCLGCHAPMGTRHAGDTGHLSLPNLLGGRDLAAQLGRDGVSCLVCHSIAPDGLGDERTFTGGFSVMNDRVAFGPRRDPADDAMRQMIHTEGRYGAHLSESALCGSCHTVVLAPMRGDGTADGPTYVEQGTYLEWRNSHFRTEAPLGATPMGCIDCHMVPASGRRGDSVVVSSRPPQGLPLRDGVRAHTLAGGNAYLLTVLARNPAAVGARQSPADLIAGAEAAKRMLRSAAELRITGVRRSPTRFSALVTVINRSGHKLPTGYPFRRVWLRWQLRAAGGEIVAAGGQDRDGAIVDHRHRRIDRAILPHVDRIAGAGQTAVWEAIPVDRGGRRTHVVAHTVGFGKDNRILPEGWANRSPRSEGITAVGVVGDANFSPGRDSVAFELARPGHADLSNAQLEVELVYQSIPRETLESYRGVPGTAPQAFVRMTAPVPPDPVVIAHASTGT